MDSKECTKCIHNAVCKTAESCDGYVSGCEHFKEEKKGHWGTDRFGLERSICSVCNACYEGDGGNFCPKCGADMRGE